MPIRKQSSTPLKTVFQIMAGRRSKVILVSLVYYCSPRGYCSRKVKSYFASTVTTFKCTTRAQYSISENLSREVK